MEESSSSAQLRDKTLDPAKPVTLLVEDRFSESLLKQVDYSINIIKSQYSPLFFGHEKSPSKGFKRQVGRGGAGDTRSPAPCCETQEHCFQEPAGANSRLSEPCPPLAHTERYEFILFQMKARQTGCWWIFTGEDLPFVGCRALSSDFLRIRLEPQSCFYAI